MLTALLLLSLRKLYVAHRTRRKAALAAGMLSQPVLVPVHVAQPAPPVYTMYSRRPMAA
jgi:hypothetical protein